MENKRTGRQPQKKDPEYDALFNSVGEIAKSLVALWGQSAKVYEPIVSNIVNSGSRDEVVIQRTLDGLLGFCGSPAAVLLYKKLCRYYYYVNSAATVSYVRSYFEMWDPESLKKIRKTKKK